MRHRHLRVALASTGLLAALAPAQATNLFVNGSFETPTVGYQRLGGGSNAITGWTTVLSGVEHFAPSANGVGAAADGQMVVDLANYTYLTGGGLEQAVTTVPGQSYDVSFAAGNSLSSGRTGTGIIQVTIDGGTTLSFNTAVATSAAMAWATRSFSFVATGSSTVVRFWNDQNPNLYFADLDAVSVQASPVPETQQAWMLLAGLGAMGAWLRRRTLA
jgi:Protein of unknown function (DUF642)